LLSVWGVSEQNMMKYLLPMGKTAHWASLKCWVAAVAVIL
jgi:hypothetical protein